MSLKQQDQVSAQVKDNHMKHFMRYGMIVHQVYCDITGYNIKDFHMDIYIKLNRM